MYQNQKITNVVRPQRVFLLFTLLLSYSYISAQKITVTGVVTDSLGTPLEMANVIAMDTEDGSLETYAVTNAEGKYRLALVAGRSYLLKASFVGMKPGEVEITPGEDNVQEVNFTLLVDEDQLDDVEIIYEMPVTMRGDTLIYNADSFTNGTERKLGDVLKKIPGIEVNESGEIQVEGKKVSKVMVDGKDFFDGDSKLATKNIPADAVSKIEVLRNHNEVEQMRGLGNDEDNIAINLQLKKGKTNFWFGDIEGGAGEGEGERYLAKANLFYYSPKGSFNLIGNANNTGDVPFTFQDYYKFTGGLSRAFNSGTSLNIRDSDLRFLTLQNNRARELRSNFGATNFSYGISDKWNISGFSIFSDNFTEIVNRTLRSYISTNVEEGMVSASEQRNQLGLAKFSSVYKPNASFQFDYDILLKRSAHRENTDAVSVVSNQTLVNPVEEFKGNEPFSLNQTGNIYYTLSDRHVFAGYFAHLYQQEDPFYRTIIRLRPFAGFLPLEPEQERFDLNQERYIKTNKFDSRVDYYYVINKFSNINFSFGTTLSRQKFDSGIFQLLDNGSAYKLGEEEFSNSVTYSLSDYFMGIKYKIKRGILTVTPGISFHRYVTENEQQGIRISIEEFLFLPNFIAVAQFKQSESLRFNYQMTANFTDVSDLAEEFVLTSYNRLFMGNRHLGNAIFHTLNLNYFNFNMFNLTNIYAGINYNKRVDAIRTTNFIEQINLVSTPVNTGRVDESLSANGTYEKTFRNFKTKLNSNLFLNNLNLIVNEEPVRSRNFTQNYQGSVLSNFKRSPHFEIGYSRSISQYKNGGVENIFYTDKPFANVEINFFQGFRFSSTWNYFNYYNRERSVRNEFTFLDAVVSYKKPESHWEFEIRGTNLLDVSSLNSDSFNENFSSTSEYFVQPRILLTSVRYNL